MRWCWLEIRDVGKACMHQDKHNTRHGIILTVTWLAHSQSPATPRCVIRDKQIKTSTTDISGAPRPLRLVRGGNHTPILHRQRPCTSLTISAAHQRKMGPLQAESEYMQAIRGMDFAIKIARWHFIRSIRRRRAVK